MLQTTNYKLNKIELADSPADITVLNVNWDKIDTELKNLSDNKFDKSGGTISGAVTVNGTLTTNHPETTSNDKSVATTYWVRNLKATASQYGLVKIADETALLNESDESALTVDSAYKLNDFRRMNTAYVVGDKVNCAFNFGLFLECTTAGTTSADTLDTRNVTHGQVITDGTVQWTVRAHVKSVDGVVPDEDGNIRCIYRSVESLGLSQSTNTIIEVIDAMPYNGGVLFDYINGSNYESFGIPSNGVLKIFRDNGSASAYLNKYGDTTDAWYANIGSETTVETIKWQKIVTTESLQNDIKSTVLDIFFPVGSIYMDATGNVNPNTQFGGTWVKIENRFLLGSGEKSVGATGGEQTHVLSVNEIPSHNHGWGTQNITGRTNFATGEAGGEATALRSSGTKGAFTVNTEVEQFYAKGERGDGLYKYLDFTGNKSWSGSTANTGNGRAHNNMPPYLVVAIWKRTA